MASIGSYALLETQGRSIDGVSASISEINAHEFINYKNIVMSNLEKSLIPNAPGVISDSTLNYPVGYRLPTFERGASIVGIVPDSWVVVWARMDGDFLDNVYVGAEFSPQVCQIDYFSDCISGRYSVPILTASELPTYLRPGDTVYAFKQ
jgi:hypothetical protein